MRKERPQTPEWAGRIRTLVDRLGITQAGLAERLGVSPATVSRWIQGRNEPTPEAYVALGNLCGLPDGVYFWERAGIDSAVRPEAELRRALQSLQLGVEELQLIAGRRVSGHLGSQDKVVAIPLLKLNAYADERTPPENASVADAEVEEVLTAPLDWCPHPESIISLHVSGDSMFPTIADGAIIIVDTASTERDHLNQKIVVVSHRDFGLKVARLQKLSGNCYLLVSANHKTMPVDITNGSKWKIFGEVLWWVSRDGDTTAAA